MKLLKIGSMLSLLLVISCGQNSQITSVVSSSVTQKTAEDMQKVNPVDEAVAENLKEYREFISKDKFFRASIEYSVDIFRMEQHLEVSDCFFDLLNCTENKVTKVDLGSQRRSEIYNSSEIEHRYGSKRSEVISELVKLLDQAVSAYNYGYGRFVIGLKSGESYSFDLNLPLCANPVQYYNYNTNEGYALTGGGGWYSIR